MDITERLRQAVKASGKTQFELGVEAGILPAVISRITSGRVKPSYDTLRKLCKALPDLVDSVAEDLRAA